jgi:hypothetical protein
MNAAGEVVGVNTYRVKDASGINGAIDGSIVIDFLNDYDFFQVAKEINNKTPYWIYGIAGFATLAVVVVVIFIIAGVGNKKKNKTKEQLTSYN